MKINPLGAELFHADGQTDGRVDMTKLVVAFRTSSKAPITSVRRVNTLAAKSVHANVRRNDFFGFHTRTCQLTFIFYGEVEYLWYLTQHFVWYLTQHFLWYLTQHFVWYLTQHFVWYLTQHFVWYLTQHFVWYLTQHFVW